MTRPALRAHGSRIGRLHMEMVRLMDNREPHMNTPRHRLVCALIDSIDTCLSEISICVDRPKDDNVSWDEQARRTCVSCIRALDYLANQRGLVFNFDCKLYHSLFFNIDALRMADEYYSRRHLMHFTFLKLNSSVGRCVRSDFLTLVSLHFRDEFRKDKRFLRTFERGTAQFATKLELPAATEKRYASVYFRLLGMDKTILKILGQCAGVWGEGGADACMRIISFYPYEKVPYEFM